MEKDIKIMILSVGAGNGHNRAAQALEKICLSDQRITKTEYLDCLDYTNVAFKDFYSKFYIKAIMEAPNLWNWAFEKTDVPWKDGAIREFFERINAKKLIKKIKKFQPTICICTHFMPAMIVSQLIGDDKLRANLSIVVTDYYIHAVWFTDIFCRYFVTHEECRQQLCAAGFPKERITISGIPIDPVFSQEEDKSKICGKFGLNAELPIILVSAGGAGMISPEEMIKILTTITTKAQIVLICGRNKKIKQEFERLLKNIPSDSLTFHVLGFTDKMHELMSMADMMIGKPGGLTSTECLAKGVIMVIWDPIPGQEIYNSVYLLESNTAIAPISATTLGYKVDELLQDKSKLEKMKESAREHSHPKAAETIMNTVLENRNEPAVKVSKLKY